jgi:hypothetical protein
VRSWAGVASPKICVIQFDAITLIAGKCSPTRFFDSWPGFLAKLYIFLMMDGIFTMKNVHQDLVAEMKPHPAELGFASPYDTTERPLVDTVDYKAVVKS